MLIVTKKRSSILFLSVFSLFIIPNVVSADIMIGPPDPSSFIDYFIISFVFTLQLESFVAFLYFRGSKDLRRIIKTVCFANIISVPTVWFIFTYFSFSILSIYLSEIFVFVFEGFFIYKFIGDITKRKAFELSFLMNITSLFLGSFIALLCITLFHLTVFLMG